MQDSLTLTIKTFAKEVSELKKMLNSHIEKIDEAMSELREEVDEKINKSQENLPDLNKVLESVKGKDGDNGKDSEVPGPEGDKGDKGERGENGKDGIDGKDGLNGLDGRDGTDGKDGKDGKDGSPDTAEQVRNKLETLRDDERLDKDAIKGLKELLEEIRKLASTRVVGGGGRVPRYERFSFAANGVATTFTLPHIPAGKGLAIWVYYNGQWLQPTVGYTVAGLTLTILFTPADGTFIEGFLQSQ